MPGPVFFIGKHFGTGTYQRHKTHPRSCHETLGSRSAVGVILSTAFVHLLQDAFENLNDDSVPELWRGSAGAIVCV